MKGDIDRIFRVFEDVTGRKINISQYQDRLRLQKLTYIVKKMGMKIDYRFNWYVRGPYSPELTKDAFNEPQEEPATLSGEDKEIERGIKSFLPGTDDDTLELVASIIYLKERRINLSDFREIFDTLHISKPWYTEEQVKDALDKIIKSKFFKQI